MGIHSSQGGFGDSLGLRRDPGAALPAGNRCRIRADPSTGIPAALAIRRALPRHPIIRTAVPPRLYRERSVGFRDGRTLSVGGLAAPLDAAGAFPERPGNPNGASTKHTKAPSDRRRSSRLPCVPAVVCSGVARSPRTPPGFKPNNPAVRPYHASNKGFIRLTGHSIGLIVIRLTITQSRRPMEVPVPD